MYITNTGPLVDTGMVPTRDMYDGLQQVYDHFNRHLFEDRLPNALITLQRKGGSVGYFLHKRFVNDKGYYSDEIALNPACFRDRDITNILAGLTHDMVHIWQHHQGIPGRGRYHNREWAEKIKAIGLQPSHTGEPGGHEVGDRMSHYVVEGGPFEQALDILLKRGFDIHWQDDQVEVTHPATAAEQKAEQPSSKSGKRAKYVCSLCGHKAWSKHDAVLLCAKDHGAATMEAETE